MPYFFRLKWTAILKGGLFLILIIILFRGMVYQSLVRYHVVNHRPTLELTDKKLIDEIRDLAKGKEMTLRVMAKIADQLTRKRLQFTRKPVAKDPNVLLETGRANCIGYAALFNAIVHFLILDNGLSSTFQTQHSVAKLYCLGFDLHTLFRDPFWQDHDFNQIYHLPTREVLAIDPTLSDYLAISRVSLGLFD